MSFQNVYYKRTVATAKPCYVCLRQTTTVLATVDVVDFLYTCDNHLSDPGFATLVPSEPSKPQVSAEEIERVKKEYEEKQKAKKEKEEAAKKEAAKEKDGKDKGADPKTAAVPKKSTPPATTPTPPVPSSPSHQKYTLHRQMFQMRLDEHKKRRQVKEVKEVAPKFPIAPRSNVS